MAASSSIAAPASTPHSSNNQWHEVFINHRGPDTKKTFARSLYVRLLSNGVSAFLDQEELQQGYNFPSQIKQAINTASVHVAILSRGYAESNWCLDELLQMLQTEAPIIPVFYGVSPAEVRWTRGKKGKYAQDIENLAKKKTSDPQTQAAKPRYDANVIENWRNALAQVADISGFELEEWNIGEEVEVDLLDKVLQRLLKILKKQKPDLHVAKFPTGLDHKLKDFEVKVGLQQKQSARPQMLGIWGLGGIGKSTLAKEFYNRRKSDYHRCCFLHDIKDSAAKGTLNLMQRDLFKSLTLKDETVNSVDKGTEMLKEPLKSCNALVILDDVDDVNQVDALVPEIHDLHSNSLILITSRDKHILISSKVENSSIYRLRGLNPKHSQVLFCSYAFSQRYPRPGFESLVDRFLVACKGMPLSLKVFGALLYGRDKSDWEDELGSLQHLLPDEIHNTFKASYNKLNKEEKQIFLDIACYFIGTDRETAIGIWNSSGWRGRRGFQVLQNKCLAEVDSRDRIRMHDHVRDLRIEFAETSSPRRLWRRTKNVVHNLLYSEIRSVRGIRMVHGEHDEDVFGVDATEEAVLERILRNLKILDTENDILESILRRVELPNLLWLRWTKCPHSTLPSWISMKNLKFLEASGSVLNTLWQREGELQEPLQLAECLEELRAERCLLLKSIPWLGQCTRLRILNISGCSELEELPNMEALVCLEKLLARDCVKLKRIRGLEQATKLQKLSVKGCSQLEELPGMETLGCLKKLRVKGCVQLKIIQGLAQCTRLRILNISGCSELEELPNMEALVCLEEPWARDVKLKCIRGLEQATRIQKLSVEGCSQLEKLPGMETLGCLEELWAKRCVQLKSIQGLAKCTRLRMLVIPGCSELEELHNMEALVCLEELWAPDCVKLKRIQGLAECTRLRILDISGCSELEELPNMEALVCLENLRARDCVKLKRIRGLEQATKLQKLSVQGCSQLEELSGMETLGCLEELWAKGCVQLKSIQGLAECTRLRILNISGCSDLEELPNMEALVCLEKLLALDCVKLKRIRGLEQATKLQKLIVQGCSQLEELPGMETLGCLKELWANGCVQLKSIQGLAQCTRLRILSISGCSDLEELPNMEALVCLEKLWALDCIKLKRIRGLEQATKLQKLSVRGCLELEVIEGVEHVSFDMVDVSKCPRLVWNVA